MNWMTSAHVYRAPSGAERALPRRAAMVLAKREGGKVYRQARDGRLLFVAAYTAR